MKIYRYEIPVDDQWHGVELNGVITGIGSRRSDVIEFWSVHTDEPSEARSFRAFGTGQELEDVAKVHGSAVTNGGLFVWHLAERKTA